MEMDKLVKDKPQTNMEIMMNLAFVNDKEVWIRGGRKTGEDCALADFVKQMCKYNPECEEYEFPSDLDELGDMYLDCSMSGCPISMAYFIGIQAAELRERLREYESKSDPVALVTRINDNGFKYSTCGSCGTVLCTGKPKFCCECGRAVKWE